jgi:hypothetical protein
VEVIGDRGLLTKDLRTATCIAHTDVKALIMNASHYENIVEISHKTTLDHNTEFTKNLEIMQGFDHEHIIKLVHSYNNTVHKEGNVIVEFNTKPTQMFILKEGKLKVEKQITLKNTNLWPTGVNKRKVLSRKRKILKTIDSINPKQVFGLHELLNNEPFKVRISVECEKAVLLSVNYSGILVVTHRFARSIYKRQPNRHARPPVMN